MVFHLSWPLQQGSYPWHLSVHPARWKRRKLFPDQIWKTTTEIDRYFFKLPELVAIETVDAFNYFRPSPSSLFQFSLTGILCYSHTVHRKVEADSRFTKDQVETSRRPYRCFKGSHGIRFHQQLSKLFPPTTTCEISAIWLAESMWKLQLLW